MEHFLLGALWAISLVLVATMLRLGWQTLRSINVWEERLRERRSMRRWLMRRALRTPARPRI